MKKKRKPCLKCTCTLGSLQFVVGIIIMVLGILMIRQSKTDSDYSGFGWSGSFSIVCAVSIIISGLFGICGGKTYGHCFIYWFYIFNIILCVMTLIGVIMHSVTLDYLNGCDSIYDPSRSSSICKDRGTAPTISFCLLVFHVLGLIISLIGSICRCCKCVKNYESGIMEEHNDQRNRRMQIRADIRNGVHTYPAENHGDSTEGITNILTPSAPPPTSNLPNNYPNQPPTLTDEAPPTYQQVMAGDYQNTNKINLQAKK